MIKESAGKDKNSNPPVNLSTSSGVSAQLQSQRSYVPAQIDLGDAQAVTVLYQELHSRSVDSPVELEQWLKDRSELGICLDEEYTRRHIDYTCDTADQLADARFKHVMENLVPVLKEWDDKLNRKLLSSPHLPGIDRSRHEVFLRGIEQDVKIFRPENIPLSVDNSKLVVEYQKIAGAQTVDYDGSTLTLQQLDPYQQELDSQVRQETWELGEDRRAQDRDALSDLYDKMIAVRHEIATNAGFADYRNYVFSSKHRFDYTPQDCQNFHSAIEQHVVPLARKLAREQAAGLGRPALRPWDRTVDSQGREPLRPFKTTAELIDGVTKMHERLERIAPIGIGPLLPNLLAAGNLDLESREGKAPGGYNTGLHESGSSFIFMNAAGINKDLITLIHEAGHALHNECSKALPLYWERGHPIEFAEVASMAMELLCVDSYDVFYAPEEAARAKREQIERVVNVLPWIAQIDAFQDWIYTNPEHTRVEREQKWLELEQKFGVGLDWSGFEEEQKYSWQKQLHLFQVPFYYIEYGIAQIGALEVWANFKQDPAKALQDYRAGLSLGDSRPLPELFHASGASFSFDASTIKPLIEMVEQQL